MLKDYYTIPEAAEFCAVARSTMWRWVKSGKIRSSATLGGQHRILKSDLEKVLSQQHVYSRLDHTEMISVNILSTDALHRKKILIVDDESNLRLLLTRTLSTKGYVAKEAADGFEAGIQVLEFKPDLVLLDLKMPGMDGFEVCRKIKGNPKTANTLVVALTGYGGDENRNRIFKAGADGFLAKPVVRDQLLNMLEALLMG